MNTHKDLFKAFYQTANVQFTIRHTAATETRQRKISLQPIPNVQCQSENIKRKKEIKDIGALTNEVDNK